MKPHHKYKSWQRTNVWDLFWQRLNKEINNVSATNKLLLIGNRPRNIRIGLHVYILAQQTWTAKLSDCVAAAYDWSSNSCHVIAMNRERWANSSILMFHSKYICKPIGMLCIFFRATCIVVVSCPFLFFRELTVFIFLSQWTKINWLFFAEITMKARFVSQMHSSINVVWN